jgi:hypothetical protein
MRKVSLIAFAVSVVVAACRTGASDGGPIPDATSSAGEAINLRDMLGNNGLAVINRKATALAVGGGIRVDAAPDIGLVWVKGSAFTQGTIDADVCGRDVQSESFVGIAFHRATDARYEAIYLRPFNFRSSSTESLHHAVQYVAMPDNGFGVLRKKAPGEFENAVSSSAEPSGWNHLRIVVANGRVQAFVRNASQPP